MFKRGLRNQFIQDVHPLAPNREGPNMVGPAFTLRYMPAREDLNPITAFEDRAHPQRKAIRECSGGLGLHGSTAARMPARPRPARSLVTRLMVRGVAGIVTDGGLRDAPEIADLGDPAITTGLPPPPISPCTRRSTSTFPIGCGDVRSFPVTSWWGTARASW